MSLNTLIEQILLSEQQLHEQTEQIKEVEVAIIRCKEKMKTAAELYSKNSVELDKKAQHLLAVKLQHDGLKESHNQMLNQIEELLNQTRHLCEHLAKIKKQSKDEETQFLQEISRFNNKFSLLGDKEAGFPNRTQTAIQELEREEESIHADLDQKLNEAKAVTESLRAERLLISQKPLTDSTCLRLRKELDVYKGQLGLLKEELRSDIHLLK
uniref:Coiled-coil domain-containing protein 172 n=1 Tax=Takifugu rubripes TaxID=31033 RepID=A0A674MTY1_TAKRU